MPKRKRKTPVEIDDARLRKELEAKNAVKQKAILAQLRLTVQYPGLAWNTGSGGHPPLKEALDAHISERAFRNYKTRYLKDPANFVFPVHGGSRPRDKKAAPPQTPTSRPHVTYTKHYDVAETGYLANVQKPFWMPLPGCGKEQLQHLRSALREAFLYNYRRTRRQHEDGLLLDLEGVRSTGQLRRLICPTSIQLRKEHLRGEARHHVTSPRVLESSFWTNIESAFKFDVLGFIKHLGDHIRCSLDFVLRAQGKPLADGFPRLTEIECMQTPPGCRPQTPHQDTRFNIIVVFVNPAALLGQLESPPRPMHSGTWVADPDAGIENWGPGSTGEVQYVQMKVPEASKSLPHAFVNWGAWPHYGPGNKTSSIRHILMYAFAVDETAAQHTTGEVVYQPQTFRLVEPIAYGNNN